MHVVDQAWVDMAIDGYIRPSLGGDYTGIPVVMPAQFWPFGGSNDMFFDLSVLAGTRVIDAAINATTEPAACSPRLRLYGAHDYSRVTLNGADPRYDPAPLSSNSASPPREDFEQSSMRRRIQAVPKPLRYSPAAASPAPKAAVSQQRPATLGAFPASRPPR
jgi:hypothetical protein